MAKMDKKNLRYNILTMMVYTIGIVLLLVLFNLQIVHGEEYYNKSNTRLTREETIQAARGNILDRNGNVMAGTIGKYSLEIYKSKINNQTLNNTILNVINILESNGDKYNDTAWEKLNNSASEGVSADDILNEYKQKYEINSDNSDDVRKIAAVRYGIEQEGYTTMKSYVISDNISTNSIAKIEEQSTDFPGVSINEYPERVYSMANLASHIIRICSTYKSG